MEVAALLDVSTASFPSALGQPKRRSRGHERSYLVQNGLCLDPLLTGHDSGHGRVGPGPEQLQREHRVSQDHGMDQDAGQERLALTLRQAVWVGDSRH